MGFLLRADGIRKSYGGVQALKGASFELRPGEVHALVGENGAGKSTLARILAGSTRADAGIILRDGREVRIQSPLDAQRLGIGIIYQELDLFPNLTLGENIVAGNLHFRERALVRFGAIERFCRPFLAQAGLDCPSDRLAGSLSIGQQQMLAIARALSMDARIILMDEPTSSLFDDAAERLFELIAGLKARGVSVVYVSHKMDEIFRICDRATVLRDGETVGTVEIAATSVDAIIRMMVGRDLEIAGRAAGGAPGEVVLSVEGLTTAKLAGVSFELRRGEVLGIAGLVGAGRSELGAALAGLDRATAGTIRARGPHRTGARGPAHRGPLHADERDRKQHHGGAAQGEPGRVRGARRGTAGARAGVRAPGAALRLPGGTGQPAQRREPAKGAAVALAAGESRYPLSGRPHARHRRRRQAGYLPDDRGARRRRQRRFCW